MYGVSNKSEWRMFRRSASNCSVEDFANALQNGLIGAGKAGCGDHTTNAVIYNAARKAGYTEQDAKRIVEMVRGVINEVR